MTRYIGLIHKDEQSDYGVSFPDFPGLIAAGASLDEARAMADEAMAFHIDGLLEDGEPISQPTDPGRIMRDPENRTGIAISVAVNFNSSG